MGKFFRLSEYLTGSKLIVDIKGTKSSKNNINCYIFQIVLNESAQLLSRQKKTRNKTKFFVAGVITIRLNFICINSTSSRFLNRQKYSKYAYRRGGNKKTWNGMSSDVKTFFFALVFFYSFLLEKLKQVCF